VVLFATFALKLYEMLGLLKKLFGPKVDLIQKLQEGAIIVDVRSSGEFAGGHVKGSKNIPRDNKLFLGTKKWRCRESNPGPNWNRVAFSTRLLLLSFRDSSGVAKTQSILILHNKF